MFIRQLFHIRTAFVLIAFVIVGSTIVYTYYLAEKIADSERKNVEQWVLAQQTILAASDSSDISLATKIIIDNISIPIIETNEHDSITNNYINLDTAAARADKNYLANKLAEFKAYAPPIVQVIHKRPYVSNKYYFGESLLLKWAKYYPVAQFCLVLIFIAMVVISIRSDSQNTQNQVWVGLAKETAHQLGTPVSSLQGWAEALKGIPECSEIVPELEKDIRRLLLVTDRFGKIGSIPKLEPSNLTELLCQMVDYVKKRASGKVVFELRLPTPSEVVVSVSPPLFDWVVENLLKNALDAMEGKGKITVELQSTGKEVTIDITDSGKGISRANLGKVFKPGFTTKKRGWGLGLTLAKRIIEQYHKGSLSIVWSEVGKGTTFRISLDN